MSMTSHRRSGQLAARVSFLTQLRQFLYRPRHRGVYRPQPSWRASWRVDAYGRVYLPAKVYLPATGLTPARITIGIAP